MQDCRTSCQDAITAKCWIDFYRITDSTDSQVKWSELDIGVRNKDHQTARENYIWDHWVLPVSWQRWLSCFYRSRSCYLIKRPLRDARLSWPRWWLHPQIVYPRKTFTYLINDQAVSWLEIQQATESHEYNVQPLDHRATSDQSYISKEDYMP